MGHAVWAEGVMGCGIGGHAVRAEGGRGCGIGGHAVRAEGERGCEMCLHTHTYTHTPLYLHSSHTHTHTLLFTFTHIALCTGGVFSLFDGRMDQAVRENAATSQIHNLSDLLPD